MEHEKQDSAPTDAAKRTSALMPAILSSRRFVLALKMAAAFIAALLIFQLGMYVGFRKANFSFGWGDNYHRNFGGPAGGFMRDFSGRDFISGHGVVGMVSSVEDDDIIIKGADRTEKIVTVGPRTGIVSGRRNIRVSDLRVGQMVTVIGKPGDDGTITAEIIRAFDSLPPIPPPPSFMQNR